MSRDKDMIYGVYDMTRGSGGCDDYFGYFKNKSGAKKNWTSNMNTLNVKDLKMQ